MNKTMRFALTLTVFGAAVASQAAFLAFNGSGLYSGGSVALTSVQDTGDDFSFGFGTNTFSPITAASGVIVLGDLSGDSLTITYTGTANTVGNATGVAATGTVTGGTGAYALYVTPNNVVSVTTNTRTTGTPSLNFTNIIGDIEAVPEPASMAALAIGAVALMRRRAKKA